MNKTPNATHLTDDDLAIYLDIWHKLQQVSPSDAKVRDVLETLRDEHARRLTQRRNQKIAAIEAALDKKK